MAPKAQGLLVGQTTSGEHQLGETSAAEAQVLAGCGPVLAGGSLSGTQSQQYGGDERQADTDWAKGISWEVLVEEMLTMKEAESEGEGTDGDIHLIDLDVEKAATRRRKLRSAQVRGDKKSMVKTYLQPVVYTRIPDRCFICLGQGHWVRSCPKKKQGAEQTGGKEPAPREEVDKLTGSVNARGGILEQSGDNMAIDGFTKVRAKSTRQKNKSGGKNVDAGSQLTDRFDALKDLTPAEEEPLTWEELIGEVNSIAEKEVRAQGQPIYVQQQTEKDKDLQIQARRGRAPKKKHERGISKMPDWVDPPEVEVEPGLETTSDKQPPEQRSVFGELNTNVDKWEESYSRRTEEGSVPGDRRNRDDGLSQVRQVLESLSQRSDADAEKEMRHFNQSVIYAKKTSLNVLECPWSIQTNEGTNGEELDYAQGGNMDVIVLQEIKTELDRIYLTSGASWKHHIREISHHQSSKLSDHVPVSVILQLEPEEGLRPLETYFKMSYHELRDPEVKEKARIAWGSETKKVLDSRRRWARGWQRVKSVLKDVRKEREQQKRAKGNLAEEIMWRRERVTEEASQEELQHLAGLG
ncbi:hypothetical protein R1sor_014989 [Riccia sorocarpa]|uniref:CCHC-type domain-containing protein n=1 Tax=Riccia sorocarpa TaxID=122646 RepID=A0ABD3HAY6_9MARC